MTKALETFQKIDAFIDIFYSSNKVDKTNAKVTLVLIYELYVSAEKLEKETTGLAESEGKKTISLFIQKNASLLTTGGQFIPEEDDGSHLKPAKFIAYTQIGMAFFIERWAVAAPTERGLMVARLLAHDTLTYPRFVSYVRQWTPPQLTNLETTVTNWLFSDFNNAYTGAQFSFSNRILIAAQIANHYTTMRENKATYCVFWGNLLAMVDKTFSMNFNKDAMHAKFKASRTQLHTAFTGHLSAQEIDIFIDHCYDDVYNWVVLGGDDDDD